MKHLTLTPLTAEHFAPFGDVISTEDKDFFLINSGSTERYHSLATVNTGADDGRAIISIFRKPVADRFPLQVKLLERHPQGSQAFIPLQRKPFLILVAPPADAPDPSAMRLFLSDGRQGVNYHAGVWHHPLITLEDDDQLLIVDRQGQLPNCDEVFFDDADAWWIAHPFQAKEEGTL